MYNTSQCTYCSAQKMYSTIFGIVKVQLCSSATRFLTLFLSLTTRTRDFRTSQSNIFAKTTKVVKLSLPVLMEPRLNLSIKKIMVENLVTLFSCWQKKDRIKSKGLEKLDCLGLQKITKGCISCLFNFVVNFFC